MIDWDEINKAEDTSPLKEAKLWLFRENIRLENEKKELAASQEKFLKERVRFQRELEDLNRRTVMERKRLKEESLFIEKKLAILQNGFKQLEEDRRSFERQRKELAQRRTGSLFPEPEIGRDCEDSVKLLFRGTSNPLALRKRYKDLMKIFHPDNLSGDGELVQLINREYLRRKKHFEQAALAERNRGQE